jgi:RNA polymerase sigma-70 factor, ECF subfamily
MNYDLVTNTKPYTNMIASSAVGNNMLEASPVDDHAEITRLLNAMALGDTDAFNQLHVRFRSLVYAVALQVLHSHEDAEDITQEIFSQLWNKSNLYSEHKGRLSSWLTTLTKNRSIDRIRSRERRSKLNNGFEKETLMEKGWRAPMPDDMANLSELGSQARTAVQTLSEEQREAILLAYFDGLTQQEISARIGTPLGTVKARIRRGLCRLRGLIHE